MRILKFRRQPTIAFFAAVNHLILTDLLGNKTLLHGFKRSWFVICGFRSVLCFSVSRFVACDRNYDWRQRKTQLWRWLLKFRVRMFVKSAAKSQCSQRPLDQAGSMGSWLSVLVYFWPQLFKRWIALSTGKITIQRISIRETNYAIRWIEIYPLDSAIQRLNNWGQVFIQFNTSV